MNESVVLPDEWTESGLQLVAEVRLANGTELRYAFLGALEDPEDSALWQWTDGNRWHYEMVEPVRRGTDWAWDTPEGTITVRTPTAAELPQLVAEPQAYQAPPASSEALPGA